MNLIVFNASFYRFFASLRYFLLFLYRSLFIGPQHTDNESVFIHVILHQSNFATLTNAVGMVAANAYVVVLFIRLSDSCFLSFLWWEYVSGMGVHI